MIYNPLAIIYDLPLVLVSLFIMSQNRRPVPVSAGYGRPENKAETERIERAKRETKSGAL